MERFSGLFKWFSLAALTAIAVAVVALFAVIELPPGEKQPNVPAFHRDVLDIQPQRGRPIPPLDVAAALVPSPQQIQQGKALYAAQCASCHGAEGRGEGAAGAALNPPPRNFASPTGWKNGYTLVDIFETLTHGLGAMPAFDYLEPKDRFALAHYVQEFGAFAHGEREDAAAYLNDKYQLAQGGRAPNKTSAAFAEERLIAEHVGKTPRLIAPQEHESAALVARVVHDPDRVAEYLAHLRDWAGNPDEMVQAAAAGAPDNGFSPEIALLSPAERNALTAALASSLHTIKE